MPALRSKIKPTSDTFAANALRMKGLLDEVQRLEGLVIAESESKRDKFEKRKQLLPRERVARLLDRGTPFLEISRLAGLHMHDDDGKNPCENRAMNEEPRHGQFFPVAGAVAAGSPSARSCTTPSSSIRTGTVLTSVPSRRFDNPSMIS